MSDKYKYYPEYTYTTMNTHKKIISTIFVILLIVSTFTVFLTIPTAKAITSQNILDNGDIETGTLRAWEQGDNSFLPSVDTNIVYSGNYAVRLASEYSGMQQTVDISEYTELSAIAYAYLDVCGYSSVAKFEISPIARFEFSANNGIYYLTYQYNNQYPQSVNWVTKSSSTISLDTWYSLKIVLENSTNTIKWYVNNVLKDSVTVNALPQSWIVFSVKTSTATINFDDMSVVIQHTPNTFSNPTFIEMHSLFVLDRYLNEHSSSTDWTRYTTGSVDTSYIAFNEKNGLELGVKSNGQGTATHVLKSKTFYFGTSIEQFNFQLSKIDGDKNYAVWGYVTASETSNSDHATLLDWIRCGLNEDGYLQVVTRVNGQIQTQYSSIFASYTWAQFVISIAYNQTWWVHAWKEDTYGGQTASEGWTLIASGNGFDVSNNDAYAYITISTTDTQMHLLGSQYFSQTWTHLGLNLGVDGRILSTYDLGIAYMIRSYYRIPNTDYAVVKDDAMAIPLTVVNENNGRRLIPGQPISILQDITQKIIQEDENMTKIQYTFKIYNDQYLLKARVEIEATYGKAKKFYGYTDEYAGKSYYKLKMVSYWTAQDYEPLKVYFGNKKVWVGDWTNDEQIFLEDFGLFSARYVGRHATWVFANLLEELGDTDKAYHLKKFMTDMGYTQDFYDSLFSKSNSLQDDYFADEETFPDESIYPNLPRDINLEPYKSRLAYTPTNMFYRMLVRMALYESRYEYASPVALCVRASHLLNKYPNNQTARQIAKQLLDNVGWDGNGTKRYLGVSPDPSNPLAPTHSYSVTAYAGYTVGTYLSSLALYYYRSNDNDYKLKAKQVVDDVLTAMQWKIAGGIINGYTIPVNYPDNAGGFLASYLPANSLGYSTNQGGIFGTLSDILVNTGVAGAPPEKIGFNPVNTESTVLALKGLWDYMHYCMIPFPNPSPSNNRLSPGIAGNWYKWKEQKSTSYASITPDDYGRTKFTTTATGKYAWKYFLRKAPYPDVITLTSTFQIAKLNRAFWGIYAGGKTPIDTNGRFATIEIVPNGNVQYAKITWTKASGQLGSWSSSTFNILDQNCTLSFTVEPSGNDYVIRALLYNQSGDCLVNKTLTVTDHKYNWSSTSTLKIGCGVYQDGSSQNELYIEWQSAIIGTDDEE